MTTCLGGLSKHFLTSSKLGVVPPGLGSLFAQEEAMYSHHFLGSGIEVLGAEVGAAP